MTGKVIEIKHDWDALLQTLLKKVVVNYDDLRTLADGLKVTGLKIGVTIGTFDLLHSGHCRYMMAARSLCDVLIVGADDDEVVKAYKKDPNRPIVPGDERLEMLLHTGYPDYVTLVTDVDGEGNWQYGILDAVRPDIFVASIGSYPEAQLADIANRVPEIALLPRQAETSTSEKVRRIIMSPALATAQHLRALAEQLEAGNIQMGGAT